MNTTLLGSSQLRKAYTSVLSAAGSSAISGASRWLAAQVSGACVATASATSSVVTPPNSRCIPILLPILALYIVLSSATSSKCVECLATRFAGRRHWVTVAGALACHRELRMQGRKRIYGQYLRQLRKAEGGLRGMNTTQASDLAENLAQ